MTVIDFSDRKVLINVLIHPQPDLTVDWRSAETHLDSKTVKDALAAGKAYINWSMARAELFRHIDNKTIVIGHALQTALDSLRVIHKRIIDTSHMVSRALLRRNDIPDIEELCPHIIDNEIVHDPMLFDGPTFRALATREFVARNIENADELELWGQLHRELGF